MKNSLLIALSLCFFILAYAADPKQQQQQQKAAQTALLVPPPSAPIAIPKTHYDPNRQAPYYNCLGTQYGISPRVTPEGTPVGTPPNPIALRYYS